MTRVAELLVVPSPSDREARSPSPGEQLERLVAEVKQDARREPRRYLRETVVAEGGE